MGHVHHINGQPYRRGATICPPEVGSGCFRPFVAIPEQASVGSEAIDACGHGDGFAKARPVEAADFSSGSGSPAAVVLAAPGAGQSHAIHRVDFGYGATPTNGQLTITDGVTTYQVPVTAAGVGPVPFNPPMIFKTNTQVSGSLSSGGSGVLGYFGFTGRSIV